MNPTSILHDEFKEFMLSSGFVSENALKKKIAEFVEDGIEQKGKEG